MTRDEAQVICEENYGLSAGLPVNRYCGCEQCNNIMENDPTLYFTVLLATWVLRGTFQ